MSAQPTSRAAYHSLQHVGSQEERIARLLAYHSAGLTIGEVGQELRMEKSTVSARLNGLRFTKSKERRRFLLDGAEMQVVETGKRKCSASGVTCLTWTVQPAGQPAQLTLNLN